MRFKAQLPDLDACFLGKYIKLPEEHATLAL
jgi:hypothetical protein